MRRSEILLVLVCAIAGCDRSAPPARPGSTTPAQPAKAAAPPATAPSAPAVKPPPAESAQADGSDPRPSPAGKTAEADPGVDLGTLTLGGYQVRVVQHGLVSADGPAPEFAVFVAGAGKPRAVRLWIGSASDARARKLKATLYPPGSRTRIPTAGQPVETSKLCVELEGAGGEKAIGTLPYKS